MEWKKIVRGLTDYKVLASLTGGILMSSGYPLEGNAVWLGIDFFWLRYYMKMKDITSQVMFMLWIFIAGYGVYYWSMIT